jgi:hypothetical protein
MFENVCDAEGFVGGMPKQLNEFGWSGSEGYQEREEPDHKEAAKHAKRLLRSSTDLAPPFSIVNAPYERIQKKDE